MFSPISHTHPVAEAGANGTPLPRGWDYWEGYDRLMIECCDDVIVLRLPGWETSTGVQAEIKIGKELEIPVEYVDYELTPTIEDMVALALQMETPVVRVVASTSNLDSVSGSPATISSVYDQGVCVGAADVCSLYHGFLHTVS